MLAPLSVRAVVLAGGHGSRMHPIVSADRPKPLLPVANRPMLFFSLFSLYRANITQVTVIVDPLFHASVSHYVHEEFPKDPALSEFKQHPSLNIDVHSRSNSAETADSLRELDIAENDVFILSSDSVSNIHLSSVLDHHRSSNSACTVVLTQAAIPGTTSKSESSSDYKPQLHALINDSERLLAMIHPTDLQSSTAPIRHSLIQRYDYLSFLSDVQDPHVYCFHSSALYHVLEHCPAISSVKFDLIPYVARRQHTLSRVADHDSWSVPIDEFVVRTYLEPSTTYSERVNTVESFESTNIGLSSGKLSSWLKPTVDVEHSDQGTLSQKQSKKKEKKPRPPVPFSPAGERVTVSLDSVVGTGCSAGDRTSVKKSIIGTNCVLGTNVKLNGCVVLSNVHIEDGANLTSTVICDNSVIKASCTLKNCRVAANTTVQNSTKATDRGFGGEQKGEAAEFKDNFGDEFDIL